MTKRVAFIALALVAVFTAAYLIISLPKRPARLNVDKLLIATQTFAREEKAAGKPVPATVSLQELLAGGYLHAADVHAFDGVEVSLSLGVDATRPQSVLARAKFPDGHEIVVLADGSVQEVK